MNTRLQRNGNAKLEKITHVQRNGRPDLGKSTPEHHRELPRAAARAPRAEKDHLLASQSGRQRKQKGTKASQSEQKREKANKSEQKCAFSKVSKSLRREKHDWYTNSVEFCNNSKQKRTQARRSGKRNAKARKSAFFPRFFGAAELRNMTTTPILRQQRTKNGKSENKLAKTIKSKRKRNKVRFSRLLLQPQKCETPLAYQFCGFLQQKRTKAS